VLELSREEVRFDTTYPDVQGNRTGDFVLIEIVLCANAFQKAAPKGPSPLFFRLFRAEGVFESKQAPHRITLEL